MPTGKKFTTMDGCFELYIEVRDNPASNPINKNEPFFDLCYNDLRKGYEAHMPFSDSDMTLEYIISILRKYEMITPDDEAKIISWANSLLR